LCLLPDLMLAGLCAFPSGRIKMFAVPGVARSLGTILAPPLSEPDQICRIPDDPRPLSGYWWSIRESGTQASVTATVEAPAYRAQELHVAAEASAQHCNDFGRGEICFGTISSVQVNLAAAQSSKCRVRVAPIPLLSDSRQGLSRGERSYVARRIRERFPCTGDVDAGLETIFTKIGGPAPFA
jgi:hypothetical protein